MVKIEPSILSAKFEDMENELEKIKGSAGTIHIDVMDGKFVTEKTPFTPKFVKSLGDEFIKDVHLMVDEPEEIIPQYIEAGSNIIIFHIEATQKAEEIIKLLKENNVGVGISLKPETPLESIIPLLDKIDRVLVMTVEPGRGGQEYIHEMTQRIKKIRELNPEIDIAVDGGINKSTAKEAADAGANILVAGSAIFRAQDPKSAIGEIRKSI